jgi:hypothetical protein
MNKKNKNLATVIAIVVIGIAGYLGFGPLFEKFQDGITGEFIAAIFGTVFTIILTMFLLNKQTEIEEEKSRGESVFNERVELYKQVIDQMNNIVEDGSISITEMSKLQFILVKLQMVAEDSTIQKFIKVYDAVSNAFSREREEETPDVENESGTIIEPEDKISILETMLEFSQSCRVELGLASSENLNKDLFSKTSESLKKSQKAVEEKKIGGARAELNLGFRELIPELIKKSKYFDKSTFKDVTIKGYPDPARDFYPTLVDNNNVNYQLATLNIYPDKNNPEIIKLRYQIKHDIFRSSDDYEGSGMKALVDEVIEKFKVIDKKYSIFTPGKSHLSLSTSRDKMRKTFYYQTYTDFSLKDFNNSEIQMKIIDNMVENFNVNYPFKIEVEKILKKLGTSIDTLYKDSRIGMKDDEEGNENE